jgi:hypothetical protein
MTPEEELVKLRLLKEQMDKATEKRKEQNKKYKEEHKEEIKQKRKDAYNALTQEEKDAYNKQCYDKRKESMLANKSIKINCPICDKVMSKSSLSAHKKNIHK